MPFTAAYKAALANRLYGGVTSGLSADIATLYFGLLTTAPAADGTGQVECAGTSYARVAKTNNTTNFPTISAGAIKVSGTAITFPSPGASDWGNIVAVGIFDASSGGNMVAWMPIPTITPALGDPPSVGSGFFEFELLL